MAKGRSTPRHKNARTLLPRAPKLRAFAQPGQRSVSEKIILSKKEKLARSRAAQKRAIVKALKETL